MVDYTTAAAASTDAGFSLHASITLQDIHVSWSSFLWSERWDVHMGALWEHGIVATCWFSSFSFTCRCWGLFLVMGLLSDDEGGYGNMEDKTVGVGMTQSVIARPPRLMSGWSEEERDYQMGWKAKSIWTR